MTWVGRLLGRGDGEPDLTPALRQARDELRGALVPLGPDGDAVADWVVTGRPGPDVLARATANRNEWYQASRGLVDGLLGQRRPLAAARLHRESDQVRERWFALLDATSHAPHLHGVLPLPGHRRWPYVLVVRDGVEAYLPDLPDRVTHAELDRLAQQQGLPPGSVVRAVFAGSPGYAWNPQQVTAVADVSGFAAAVEQHLDLVRPLVTAGDDPRRLQALTLLDRLPDETLAHLVDELVELAVGGRPAVVRAAAPLVSRCGAAGRDALERSLVAARPPGRRKALVLLRSTAADEVERTRLSGLAGADRAAAVRELVEVWQAEDREARAVAAESSDPVPVAEPDVRWAVDRNRAVDRFCAHLAAQAQAFMARSTTQGHRPLPLPPVWLRTRAELADLLRAHLGGEQSRADRTFHLPQASTYVARSMLEGVDLAGVGTVAVVKGLDFYGLLEDPYHQGLAPVLSGPVRRLRAADGGPDLLELSAVMRRLGPGPQVVVEMFAAGEDHVGADWPDEDVLPFVELHADVVVDALTARSHPYGQDRSRLFDALARVPRLRRPVLAALVDVAVGGRTADQLPAQRVLAGVPDVVERATARLGDTSPGPRAAAARWLGRLGGAVAAAAVTDALDRERNEQVTVALLDALVAMGRSIEAYVSPESLAGDAERGLRKGLPASVSWVPWDGLPRLRWTGTDQEVEPTSVRWLVVQAVKARTPEPSALLRRYAAMVEPADRPPFALSLLQQWVAEDTRPMDPADAEQAAHRSAAQHHAGLLSHPQYHVGDPMLGLSLEEVEAAHLTHLLRQPVGSATTSRGVLAVVAAFAGPGVARPVETYLNTWYGNRSAQCKALLGMLAWVDSPDATQLLLQVANRFRTKGVQEEARRLAEQVAARRGWTTDELADRTVPTGGLDHRGVLELPYGERVFTATLTDDGTLVLRDPEGKAVRSLPQPRSGDDADLAAQSRAALTAARKQVKAELARQRDRLAVALVTQRDWEGTDWVEHVVGHPLVGRLARGLVWVVEPAGGSDAVVTPDGTDLVTVRPLPDGTLTDVDDDEVALPVGARVRLAHDALLDPALSQRWQQHLLDYEVVPPFPQLGREVHSPVGLLGARVDEFDGYVLESFRLRGRLTRTGWTRGPAVDGGWFVTYERRLAGLVAELGFSGSELPETNRPVTLQGLEFRRTDEAGRTGPAVPLAEVPPVVLSECLADLHAVAAMGARDPELATADA